MAKLPQFKPDARYDVTLKAPITIGRQTLRVTDKHRMKGSVAEKHKDAIEAASEVKD